MRYITKDIQSIDLVQGGKTLNGNELQYMYHAHDEGALDLMLQLYKPDIDKMIRKHYLRGFKAFDEEDLYQLAMMQLIEALQTYREERGVPFLNYYLFILKNAFINLKRSLFSYGKENERSTISIDQQVSEENASYLSEYIPSKYPDFEANARIQQERFRTIISKVMSDLNELEVNIFVMRQVGYSYTEIAESLDVSEKKVDNTLAKIRRGNYMKDY